MVLNTRLQSIEASATVALSDKIRKIKTQGISIISLQTGDPDFNTPIPIIQACYESLQKGETHYSFSNGLFELRKAISEKIETETGVAYDPEKEILITNGGVHALFCALSAIINPKDEVLIQDPSWMPYKSVVSMLGGVPKIVNSHSTNNFWAPIEELDKNITPLTKAIIINSPNNPTGMVASRQYLESILTFADRNDLMIITDEVYRAIAFDGVNATSLLSIPGSKDNRILIDSFSKSYAMTGWRLGYVAASQNIISQIQKSIQYTVTNVPVFIQRGGLCAITNKEVALTVSGMYKRYEERRNMVDAIFRDQNSDKIKLFRPEGAFYVFLDISGTGISSAQFASLALDNIQVAVAPGSVYGEAGEGFVRLTTAAHESDIQSGLMRMINWANENF